MQRTQQKPAVVQTWFTLQAAHIQVIPPGLHAGQTLTAEITGFQASEQVTVSWSANGGQTLTTITADETGQGDVSLAPPQALPGPYTLTAVGASSGLQAQATVSIGPGIEVNPTNVGDLGQMITVVGGGFSANESIDVFFQQRSNGVVTTTSDSIGSFSASLTLPDTFNQTKNYHIYAVSSTNGERSQIPFILQSPIIDLQNRDPFYGEQNDATGIFFVPGESVQLYWDYQQPGQILLGTATADSTGSYDLPFTVPSEPNMSNVTYTAIGLKSKIVTTIQVYESADLILKPTSGPAGTRVQVSGGGFAASETVTLSVQAQTNQTVATSTTEQFGAFNASFVFPQGTGPGLFNVLALGTTSQVRAEVYFTIIPEITLTPNTGPSNTKITISGSSYYVQADDQRGGGQALFTAQ